MSHLEWTRTQHPVGQGFFHSGQLDSNCRKTLTYVYDCGSVGAHKSSREECIQTYIEQQNIKTKLDILFISHFHYDHISGIKQLVKGLGVDTVVMPLLSPVERLIAFARTLEEQALNGEEGTESIVFYRSIIVNPIQALRDLGVRQILLVRASERPSEGPADRTSEGLDIGGPGETEGRISLPWKLITKGKVTPLPMGEGTDKAFKVFEVFDTSTLSVFDDGVNWLFYPFIVEEITNKIDVFLENLCAGLKTKLSEFNALKPDAFVKKLDCLKFFENFILGNEKQKIMIEAYKSIAPKANLNLTSMCLYIGPDHSHKRLHFCHYLGEIYLSRYCYHDQDECFGAWLGTGDAELGTKKYVGELWTHYGSLLDYVTTMTVPHHGSERNLNAMLLDIVKPEFCIVAADTSYMKKRNWKHPSHKVAQIIGSAGALMMTVTSQPTSKLKETIRYHF